MKVLDASALVELLLGTPRGRWVRACLADGDTGVGAFHAPAHLDVEVGQALRRIESSGEASPERCRAAVEILGEFPVRRHLVTPFLARIWDYRMNLTAYDAAYVALAEALDCPLVTFDERLAGSPGLPIRIIRPGEA